MARRIGNEEGMAALRAVYTYFSGAQSDKPERAILVQAVRFALEEIAERHPGKSVEIRVPYAGAVQAFEGLHHRRGTPPNVIETDIDTFLALAVGALTWQDACDSGRVDASGTRATLDNVLPLFTSAALERR